MIQFHKIDIRLLGEIEILGQFYFVLRAPFCRPAAACVINQDLAHELGRNRDKMRSALRAHRPVAG